MQNSIPGQQESLAFTDIRDGQQMHLGQIPHGVPQQNGPSGSFIPDIPHQEQIIPVNNFPQQLPKPLPFNQFPSQPQSESQFGFGPQPNNINPQFQGNNFNQNQNDFATGSPFFEKQNFPQNQNGNGNGFQERPRQPFAFDKPIDPPRPPQFHESNVIPIFQQNADQFGQPSSVNREPFFPNQQQGGSSIQQSDNGQSIPSRIGQGIIPQQGDNPQTSFNGGLPHLNSGPGPVPNGPLNSNNLGQNGPHNQPVFPLGQQNGGFSLGTQHGFGGSLDAQNNVDPRGPQQNFNGPNGFGQSEFQPNPSGPPFAQKNPIFQAQNDQNVIQQQQPNPNNIRPGSDQQILDPVLQNGFGNKSPQNQQHGFDQPIRNENGVQQPINPGLTSSNILPPNPSLVQPNNFPINPLNNGNNNEEINTLASRQFLSSGPLGNEYGRQNQNQNYGNQPGGFSQQQNYGSSGLAQPNTAIGLGGVQHGNNGNDYMGNTGPTSGYGPQNSQNTGYATAK